MSFPLNTTTKPEDLLCKVSRSFEGGPDQAEVVNNHSKLREFDAEYVAFSGFFGTHGPDVFAAAPELLQAVRDAIVECERSQRLSFPLKQRMRAAIAKAEGRAC